MSQFKPIYLIALLSAVLVIAGCTRLNLPADYAGDDVITLDEPVDLTVGGSADELLEESETEENEDETGDEVGEGEDVATAALETDEPSTAEVTWLETPEQLPDLELFTEESTADFEIATYHKIADLSDGGSIVYSVYQTLGSPSLRFRIDPDGTAYILVNHSSDGFVEYYDQYFDGYVLIDRETLYPELLAPDTLTVADLALTQFHRPFSGNDLFDLIDEEGEPVVFGTDELGTVYEVREAIEASDNDSEPYESKVYLLKLADTTVVRYISSKDFRADDGSLLASLDEDYRETFTGRTFLEGFLIRDGCGLRYGDQLLTESDAGDLVRIGEAPSGRTLYTIENPDSRVLQSAYASYTFIGEADFTYEQFVQELPLVIWQDAAGDYSGYLDMRFIPPVECGKPVIYLYPEEKTEISVQVGADITISEPQYTVERNAGWTTTAYPDGTLIMGNGDEVRSLYWEGQGWGRYPQITHGRVIKTENAERELRRDLHAQGLNKVETQDFLDFWMEHLPNTQYMRLSWFTTEQMDTLAPLQVTPRPDTVQRVFLDFAGQDTPYTKLKPQKLESFDRVGFTLVEWGGLLVGGHE